jgi:hypothetical protein
MATTCKSVVWVDHTQEGQTYSLAHLRPTVLDFHVPACGPTAGKPARPARTIKVLIQYSHHCFTQGVDQLASQYNPDHLYTWLKRPDDVRVFCPNRWDESKALPTLIRNLQDRACYPTRRHNFFAVKRAVPDGHYTIYFRVDRENSTNIRLFVESAYVRTDMDAHIANAASTTIVDILVNSR